LKTHRRWRQAVLRMSLNAANCPVRLTNFALPQHDGL